VSTSAFSVVYFSIDVVTRVKALQTRHPGGVYVNLPSPDPRMATSIADKTHVRDNHF
jgi:hypothetical protein